MCTMTESWALQNNQTDQTKKMEARPFSEASACTVEALLSRV